MVEVAIAVVVTLTVFIVFCIFFYQLGYRRGDASRFLKEKDKARITTELRELEDSNEV